MSLFNFSSSTKPKVTKKELKRAAYQLDVHQGFSKKDVTDMRKVLSGHMNELGSQRGLDKKEIDASLKWMRNNMSKHSLSRKQVDKMEKELRKRL
jgi:hypothetical protein